VWELATRSVMYIDTGLKQPTFLKWSKTGPQLAIGAAKGGLIIYRKDNRKKLPITGKHSAAITCGDWSRDNTLALGGADSLLTLSTADGDTIEQTELKYAPIAIQFATQKTDARLPRGTDPTAQPDTTVSVNMGGKTMLLYNRTDPDHPVELAFQAKYGRIVRYVWFGDGYLLIGFSEGWVVVISTHLREIGEELFSGRFHKDSLEDIACSVAAQRAASAGGNSIKLIDMQGWKEQKTEWASVDAAHGPIESLAWTSDGQLLTAATRSGHLYTFLARVATIVDAHGPRVAYMSSLREVSVLDTTGEAETLTIPVSVEPAVLAIGASHVAIGMNNRVWYYRLVAGGRGAPAGSLIMDRDYVGTVDEVRLGASHAAVLCGGKVYVHAVEPGAAAAGGNSVPAGRTDMKTLPERDAEGSGNATCIAIAGDFLFYGTSGGKMHMFNLAGVRGGCGQCGADRIAAL
jgi:WD repeat-containing protein 19